MQKKAYSLIELSIVILIVAILISGALTVFSGSANNTKITTTKTRIDEIYKALGGFLLVNGRLPCPASVIAIKSTDATYGVEGTAAGTCTAGGGVYASGSSNLVYGLVPVKTLGLPNEYAEDGFEGKIAYIVEKNFTASSTFKNATATATMTLTELPGGVSQVITDDAILALVSYGSNKAGAFNANGTVQNTRSSDSSEMENDLGSSNAYDKNLIFDAPDSDVFDDIVFYKTRNSLVSDFDALSLVNCLAGTLSLSYPGAATYSWPESSYNQVISSTTACPAPYTTTVGYPTRRCGAFGIWESNVINPCTL
ncbi:MAG: prepilin-type N-terminal cleavage/methylation domain-containing protein [Pseudomonadota bacterium]